MFRVGNEKAYRKKTVSVQRKYVPNGERSTYCKATRIKTCDRKTAN